MAWAKRKKDRARWGPASSAGGSEGRAGADSPSWTLSARPAAVFHSAWLDREWEEQGRRGVAEERERPGPLGPGVVSGRGQEVGGGGLTVAGAESASRGRVGRRVARRAVEDGGWVKDEGRGEDEEGEAEDDGRDWKDNELRQGKRC